jgi:hypothetical protein
VNGEVNRVTENKETEELCECEFCKAWRDEENMYVGTFKIPKAAFDVIQEAIPVIRESNGNLKNSSDPVVLGFALGKGAKTEVRLGFALGKVSKRSAKLFSMYF